MAITSPPYFFALALQGLDADLPSGTDYPQETLFWATDTSTLYVNDGTTFNAVAGGGGSGTVTDVTSGDSSILVTNPTTTPDLSVQDSPAVGGVTVTGTPTAGQVLTATDATDADWEDAGTGTVTDVTSDDGSILVTNPSTTPDLSVQNSPAVGGITVTGTPTAGQVLTATDGSDADWQDVPGTSLEVTDGSTAVNPATELDFTSGAVVTDGGGGVAQIAISLGPTIPYVTVQTGAPAGPYQTPLVFDTTAVTGGLYGWDGSAYQKIGGPL